MSEVQTQGCGLIESKASRGTKEGVLGQNGMSQMDVEAPKEQRKSHCGRTGYLAKDGWQNKSGKVTSEKGRGKGSKRSKGSKGSKGGSARKGWRPVLEVWAVSPRLQNM